MRKYLYTLITLLLVPVLVNAETLEYNICKSGCEYSTYAEVFNHYQEMYEEVGEEELSTYDVIINFEDSETYEEDYFGYGYVNSLTINGNNAKIIANGIAFSAISKVILNNLDMISIFANFYGRSDNSEIGKPEYNGYKKSIFSINNCSIKATARFSTSFSGGTFYISNTFLSGIISYNLMSDINITNSYLSPVILYSGFLDNSYDTNIFINLKDLEKNKKIIRCLSDEENFNEIETKYPEINESDIKLDKYFFLEVPLTEELINNGITKTNNIFIKQEVSKNIKDNTNISEFESEFVNTYEDSIGYDDIKDLPIEWKSENESIAKIENGVIVPVSVGNVDLVGKRGNDIYTIHLTVEKETIPEKIDKMTIKVPITGSKIKAWVVVVSVVLLGVIGTCSYMLIRRKK